MRIGSIIWRFYNYGMLATVKYILNSVYRYPKIEKKPMIFTNFKDLAKWFDYQNSMSDEVKISEMVDDVLEEIEEYFAKFQDSMKKKIKGHEKLRDDTKTRLFVLAYFIQHLPITKIIETGTQHGISSLVIEKALVYSSKENTKFISYDVKKDLRLDSYGRGTYKILISPVRKNFKIDSYRVLTPSDFLLFFHDGDHSRENMAFEFEWAYEKLGAKLIVSDDIENNNAFLNFCNRKGITAYGAKFDQGPMVGIAFAQIKPQETSDPDGT